MTEAAPIRRGERPRRPTVVGVLGELLVTVGVLVLLFVVWQLWIGDVIIGAQRNAEGASIAQAWTSPTAPPTAADTSTSTDTPTSSGAPNPTAPPTGPPVVLPQPGDGQVFGVMRVPRFGAGFAVPVAGGVSRDVTLDPIGIGHYPDTAMPGEVGNFAVAGHRTTYGAPFADLPSLRIGDAIVIETADGWYTYRFRDMEYVAPTAVDVLLPVPQQADIAADGSYLTMTTCSPRFSATERLVAYGAFESFTPRDAASTPPASLTLAAGA